MLALPITQTMHDPNLFGKWFAGGTFGVWEAVLKATFVLPHRPAVTHRTNHRPLCSPNGDYTLTSQKPDSTLPQCGPQCKRQIGPRVGILVLIRG